MNKKIGIGIIGIGMMGNIFAKIINQNPFLDLVGITGSRDFTKIEKLSTDYKTIAYKNYKDLINNSKVDAVFICLPENLHTEPAIESALAGKHLFIEKPIASKIDDAEKIINAVNKSGVKLIVGHSLRFDPRYSMAKDAIENGEIGEIVSIYSRRNTHLNMRDHYNKRTSLVLFLGIHDVDIINCFVQKKVKRVFAESNKGMIEPFSGNDTIFSTLKFENGSVALIENSWATCNESKQIAANSRMQVEVIGTKGSIFIDGSMNSGLKIQGTKGTLYPDTQYMPKVMGLYGGVFVREVSYFTDCLLKNKKPSISGEAAKYALLVVNAIENSLKTGKVIEM